MSSKRRKHQALTVKWKLEIRVDSLPPEKKKKDVASEYGIAPSTLSTNLKDKEKLRALAVIGKSKKKCHRDPTRPEIDAALSSDLQPCEPNRFQSVERFLK